MNLKDYSDEDLEKEILRRDELTKPEPLTNITIEQCKPLIDVCKTYVIDLRGKEVYKKNRLIVFKTAMEIVYGGKNIWKYLKEVRNPEF